MQTEQGDREGEVAHSAFNNAGCRLQNREDELEQQGVWQEAEGRLTDGAQ